MADTFEKWTSAPLLLAGDPGNDIRANTLLVRAAALAGGYAKSRTTATPPGAPVEFDAYILPSGATDAWAPFTEDDIVVYLNGWEQMTPQKGMVFRIEDEDNGSLWYDGANWTPFIPLSIDPSVTADPVQVQGNGQLTKVVNVVTTVANANDVVTLPVAAAGMAVVIANQGANNLQVYPNVLGATINGGAPNGSVVLATNRESIFFARSSLDWVVDLN